MTDPLIKSGVKEAHKGYTVSADRNDALDAEVTEWLKQPAEQAIAYGWTTVMPEDG